MSDDGNTDEFEVTIPACYAAVSKIGGTRFANS